jgi:putative addiction module component (TIGR02574 family)
MPATVEFLIEEAMALSEDQRAQLAQRLLQSLEPLTEDRDVQVAWDAEIARRVQRVNEGTANGRPAEEVFRDLRARYQ